MALRPSPAQIAFPPSIAALDDGDFALSTRDFELIASIAKEQAGIVIRAHKSAMIRGRLMRRLRALQLRTVAEYCELLRGPQADRELPQLLNVLTTNHTAFFRERHHFDHLKPRRLPETIERAQRGGGRDPHLVRRLLDGRGALLHRRHGPLRRRRRAGSTSRSSPPTSTPTC